ncbi:PAS domain S-box protein [Nitrosophilus alvini]|uniref:hybrid sensor histidine kinase/response regulator n=1 Tax=Nitrosophilus alvini TaxID=2714855 RepID=UPI001F160CB3|nr:PAS domain S-box protein [Nitrosophilus alvini]
MKKIKLTRRPLRKFTLLYVEDSVLEQKKMLPVLNFYFPKIHVASNGKEGLEIFEKTEPDIVISDTKMPEMDGISMAKEIRKINKHVPIILFGNKSTDCLLEAIEAKVDRYLLKPVDIKKLHEILEETETKIFLEKARSYNTFLLHQYKQAIDSSNIVSKTDINGIITYVNDEFCKISGYSREELIGKNHNIVRHPDIPKEVYEKFWNTILSKKIWKGTVKNRAKDGSTFYVNTTVVPIVDSNGKIVEFVAIRYDVTESVKLQERLKRKEEDLEKLNRELERRVEEQTRKLRELNLTLEKRVIKEVEKNRQKDKLMFQQARLASLGEMIGNIAHQWRQPLMELGILLYNIKKRHDENTLDKKMMQTLYEKSNSIIERMSQTISDFQNFFKPNKKKESFNIEKVIKDSLTIVEGSLEKSGIEIKMDIEKNISIEGYSNEFSQVIVNIINNAKDVLNQKNPENKKIEISVKTKSEQTGNGKKDFVEIFIKDNGGGIDKKIIDKIFEPYFTTKHSKQGTGIGLYMSKMIIEQSMNGTLEARNHDDGAEFIIKLPLEYEKDGKLQKTA